jgi:large subunit ribosomal protein L17
MRHRKKTVKLGRTSAHREALMAGLVCNLIEYRRIVTTLPKAKAARGMAEKMVTLGKRGTLAARRQAISRLRRKDRVATLFSTIAPAFQERAGGYTRILKLGRRPSDSSEMAILEWVDYTPSDKPRAVAPSGAEAAKAAGPSAEGEVDAGKGSGKKGLFGRKKDE